MPLSNNHAGAQDFWIYPLRFIPLLTDATLDRPRRMAYRGVHPTATLSNSYRPREAIMPRNKSILKIIVFAAMLGGCASIMHGTSQEMTGGFNDQVQKAQHDAA